MPQPRVKDGPRQRYLARVLDPDTLAPVADQWTDYVGDAAVLDYRVDANGDDERLVGYLPGVSQTDLVADETAYVHADHLGSTWYTSSTLDTADRAKLDDGSAIGVERRPAESRAAGDFEVTAGAIRTAFGETVNASWNIPESRYGYAGAHGYQEHDFASSADPGVPDGNTDAQFKASPTEGFPYMHLGARYYDPGSGRFLQRDPIGLRGALNVYGYVGNGPLGAVDPSGLSKVTVCNGGDCTDHYYDEDPPRPAGQDEIVGLLKEILELLKEMNKPKARYEAIQENYIDCGTRGINAGQKNSIRITVPISPPKPEVRPRNPDIYPYLIGPGNGYFPPTR